MAIIATTGPGLVVEQPHLHRPRLSLLSAADFPVMTPDEKLRFGLGFKYFPEGAVVTGIWPMCETNATDPGSPDFAAQTSKTPNVPLTSVTNPWIDSIGAVDFWPYTVYASDAASTGTLLFRRGEERALRKLDVAVPFNLEYELWTGSLNVVGRSNPSLQNSATTLAGPVTPMDAIALLEQAVATGDARGQQEGGFRYMIHMRPKVLDWLAANGDNNLMRREGNMWLTPMDNILVAGRGYPGTGPAKDTGGVANGPGIYAAGAAVTATSEWMYISPVVEIRMDEPFPLSDDLKDLVRRDTNDVTFWCEQIVHAAFDPTLNIYAINVCLTAHAC